MKQTLIAFIFAFYTVGCWAQNYVVKPQKATADDYIKLMNFAKYEAFSFDISSLVDSTRVLEFYYREYEHGNMIGEKCFCVEENRIMISVFDEEDQKAIHEEGSAYDEANGVYEVAKSITIGFQPFKNDSTERMFLQVDEMSSKGVSLRIKPAINPTNGDTILEYLTRPYVVDSFEFNKFIPLVLYGSMWYDERLNGFRFCGENELIPGKTSSMEKFMPHYYIIGVKIH